MLKKIALAVLCVSLLAGCGDDPQNNLTLDAYLVGRTLTLADLARLLAGSEGYIRLFSVAPELLEEIKLMPSSIEGEPEAAIIVTASADDLLDSLSEAQDGSGDPGLRELPEDFITGKALSALPNILSSQGGAQIIAAVSVASVEESFKSHKNLEVPTLILLDYGSDYAFCAILRPSMEETAIANGVFCKLPANWQTPADPAAAENLLGSAFPYAGIMARVIAGEDLTALLEVRE